MRRWPLIAIIAAAVLIAVVAVMALLHLVWLGAATAAVAVGGYVSSSRSEKRRRRADPAFSAQERLIRRLWRLTRRLPADTVVTDPLTGCGLVAERSRGFLALLVTDPPASDPGPADAAIMHRYLLGFAGRPIRPPLFHDVTTARGRVDRMSWRQASDALQMAEQTGVADTDPMELAALVSQLDRALMAWRQAT